MIKSKSKTRSKRQRGVALVIVLSLIAVMTLLAVTFFVSVSGEGKSSQHQSDGAKAGQLATSAAQMVMAQIQAASTATPAGAGAGVAWTSQPGLLRTFPSSGPSKVFKLYSASTMVTDSFQETDDAPPADWKQSPALYSDINAPALVSSGTGLVYPVADPGAAGVVPGFTLGSAPGFTGGSPSPSNNPLPMPVRWLYVLKNGDVAVPDSAGADGTVTFAPTSAQPAEDNPVVGRVAFWADDETCKVNVNTAGYAKNDASYWSFWDTPRSGTTDEWSYLAGAQPWTNEFQRYPGHPATTDMSLVFAPLSLTDDQVLSLSPFYKAGGTKGGTVQVSSPPVPSDVPTQAQIRGLLKSQRLFASVDELFYDPIRGINTVGILWQDLEARRFLLTTSSRAPETTLFDTPRVTIWPAWRTESKRTPIERLIAFCSTIAPGSSNPQNFYFVRENSLSDRELLDFPENLKLWNYLRTLAGRPLPVLGASIVSKYTGSKTDQILTSVFDAIRLANLDDRSGPADGQTTGYSFTRGELKKSPTTGLWTLKDPMARTIGFVAPTKGPNGTFSPGRTACLQEVAISFARNAPATTSDPKPLPNPAVDSNGVLVRDKVVAMMLYCFSVPTPGSIAPGQDMRIAVSGLSGFRYVTANGTEAPIFPNDTFNNMQTDRGNPAESQRGFGRPEWTMSAQTTDPAKGAPATGGLKVFVPLTGEMVLPIEFFPVANPLDAHFPNWTKTFTLKGATVTIALYSPASASTPLRTYQVTFPDAQVLTPFFSVAWSLATRFADAGLGTPPEYTIYGDSLLAMQSPTTDPRYDALQTGTITNFVPHARYGKTDPVGMPLGGEWQSTAWSRRASFIPVSAGPAPQLVLGQLIEGGPTIDRSKAPLVASAPAGVNGQSIQRAFPPGDFSNGVGFNRAGGWGAKSDEGSPIWGGNDGQTFPPHPYFQSEISGAEGSEGMLSSPNRQMPSAVLFGSICSGAPWRTLLFRPARSYLSGGSSHFGNQSPPDWAILDFFHMPVVEPYAISEPFATAGKVNLNARIIPFSSYLTRETALRAVLASVRLTAIPSTLAPYPTYNSLPDIKTRYPLDPEETLRSVRARLNGTDGSGRSVFLSAGEVCSMDLVPQGETRSSLAAWWADKSKLTGDNSLESPYATLVPRLTARSNTYTVHVTAQSLAPGAGVVGWREGRGRVTAEWRGAISVERYVDPNDSRFTGPGAPDFLSGTQPVGPYYRFRVLGTRRFNP